MKLTFLGATGTVTGSRYLIEHQERKLLIDCGLFQGFKQLRLKNWAPPPFEPSSIGAIVLTHAHLDHSGYIPLLVKLGFHGKIFCTRGTYELCRILLPNSGFLQEEQADFENRHGFSKHKPALPLYTQDDAERSLKYFEVQRAHDSFATVQGVIATLHRSGHLLGASSVRLHDGTTSVTFSGDIGRANDPLMNPPEAPQDSDYVIIESTYGDRLHPAIDMTAELAPHLRAASERNATVIVPAFAVGRAQLLLLLVSQLKARGVIRDIPVYLDSPMAIDATELYRSLGQDHRLAPQDCAEMLRGVTLVRTAEESKALAQNKGPQVIISASGMATGGRVLHHLKRCLPDPNNLILLAGFQAGGTRGASLAAGAQKIRIYGDDVPVKAQVVQLSSMSSHADADGLVAWLRTLPRAPSNVFVTHGEPTASDALRQRIERDLKWRAIVPEFRDSFSFAALPARGTA